MKTTTQPSIDRAEWDFSQIDDPAIQDAAVYEYARSCPKLRAKLCRVLNSKIAGRMIREHLHARLLLIQNRKRVDWLGTDHERAKVHDEIDRRAAVLPWGLWFLIRELRPDFPTPWTSFKMVWRQNHQPSIRILPGGLGQFGIDINWSHNPTVRQIIDEFSIWIRQEAKRHTRPAAKRPQLRAAPLASLAAYRLQESGFTFPQAQAMLKAHGASCTHHPFYSDKSTWSDAIRRARDELKIMDQW